ncbi:NAD(P)H quinone oxidoreductase, PIG3 family [Syncephalis pseudoplumigaleata]|uniref:NAD(P)H quinone oxidoreductase, PIG3 family n=1 Tax=Syncephalis pseudoplumigaleata TaxID=1712513 RepID=A0A4P9Z0T2_9FUNG|nr:NAD(P)H quinone oxidoreductase, PIG3 family [Syncephalis pseudoplumigaleata]|eukprot:RKP26073.1 NAD(P)H quinone oxidoreductase, PIG3 family [Syncephalis pseudoplumigaleata]
MLAIIYIRTGDASQLYIGSTDRPTPRDNELLVRVKACALNRMDILQRHGRYPLPPGASAILGVEMAGIVEACGASGNGRPGDRVFGLMLGGAYAQYCAIEEAAAIGMPESMSFEEAASLPEVWYTAYQALHFIGGLQAGQDVLIHGGASGVGMAAIQLAKMAQARRIVVTCGSEEKVAFCKSLGATHAVNYKADSFRSKARTHLGVNLIVDMVGANYWTDNIASLSFDGRLVILAFMSGTKVADFDIAPILGKRLRIEGTTLRSRSLAYQCQLRDQFAAQVLPRIRDGTIKHIVDRVFSWRDVADAHRYMESNQSRGKIVLTVD